LTGAGESIGQLELKRPGKPGTGFDDAAHSNFGTIPHDVFDPASEGLNLSP
jgi:hypothetical protein